eukprot:3077603-Pyramimonas_sp.AAC.1
MKTPREVPTRLSRSFGASDSLSCVWMDSSASPQCGGGLAGFRQTVHRGGLKEFVTALQGSTGNT